MTGAFVLLDKDAAGHDRPLRRGLLRRLLAGYLLAIVPGCEDSGPRPSIGVHRIDSAGVEVVIVPGPLLDDLPVRSLAAEPVLSIAGDQFGEAPLSRIGGALILSDTGVAIGDRTLDRVVLVSCSAGLLHRFGRRGNGPGELGDVSGLRRRADDELVVWDESRGQLVVYDTAGVFREMLQTPRVRTAQRGLEFPGFLADGSPVFERRAVRQVETFTGVRRPEFVVDRYRPDGAFDGALVSIPGKEVVGFNSGRTWLTIGVGLTGAPHLTIGGGRAFLGHGERFEIHTWSAGGLERITRINRARRAASRSDKEAIRDSILARHARSPIEHGIRLSRSDIPVGDSFPAFEGLHADAEGGVWIAEGGKPDGPPSWVILDRAGEPTARIHTPIGFDVIEIRDDLVLGVSPDAFDVPSVLLYRIEEGTPESPGSTEVGVANDCAGAGTSS